jgi:hypothetical protein
LRVTLSMPCANSFAPEGTRGREFEEIVLQLALIFASIKIGLDFSCLGNTCRAHFITDTWFCYYYGQHVLLATRLLENS